MAKEKSPEPGFGDFYIRIVSYEKQRPHGRLVNAPIS